MIDNIILQEDNKGSVCCKNAIDVIRFYERYEKNEFCFGDVTSLLCTIFYVIKHRQNNVCISKILKMSKKKQ